MSFLSIVQSVARRVKIPPPVSVVNSTDPNVLQLWELANEEGLELSRAFNWQALLTEGAFVTNAATVQPAIPGDLRSFVPDSFWNQTTNRPLIGPVTPARWQALQAFPNITTPEIAYRELQGQLLFYPIPPAGQNVTFEYVSNSWAQNALGTPQTDFQQDTDVAILDETLIGLGVRWRFKSANGLDYAEDFRTYETQKAQAQARDGGLRTLDLAPWTDREPWTQVPLGNFPGV